MVLLPYIIIFIFDKYSWPHSIGLFTVEMTYFIYNFYITFYLFNTVFVYGNFQENNNLNILFVISVCKCRIFLRINSDLFCLLCRYVCRGLNDNNWRGDHASRRSLGLGFDNSRGQDVSLENCNFLQI